MLFDQLEWECFLRRDWCEIWLLIACGCFDAKMDCVMLGVAWNSDSLSMAGTKTFLLRERLT